METIKFETNVPQIFALAFSEGKPVISPLSGAQLMFSTIDGRRFYVPPIVGDKLREPCVTARMPIEVCKKQVGRSIEWHVKTHNAQAGTFSENVPARVQTVKQSTPTQAQTVAQQHAMTAALDATYTAMAQPAAVAQRPVVLRMMASLCAAVDAAMEAEVYGARQGRDFTFSEESIRCIANAIFINESKNGSA